jgi:hypothetical protein
MQSSVPQQFSLFSSVSHRESPPTTTVQLASDWLGVHVRNGASAFGPHLRQENERIDEWLWVAGSNQPPWCHQNKLCLLGWLPPWPLLLLPSLRWTLRLGCLWRAPRSLAPSPHWSWGCCLAVSANARDHSPQMLWLSFRSWPPLFWFLLGANPLFACHPACPSPSDTTLLPACTGKVPTVPKAVGWGHQERPNLEGKEPRKRSSEPITRGPRLLLWTSLIPAKIIARGSRDNEEAAGSLLTLLSLNIYRLPDFTSLAGLLCEHCVLPLYRSCPSALPRQFWWWWPAVLPTSPPQWSHLSGPLSFWLPAQPKWGTSPQAKYSSSSYLTNQYQIILEKIEDC